MEDISTENTLKKIEALYLDGKFEMARDELLAIKDKLSTGQFHYNLGTILFKENQYGPARFNLELAKQLGFSYPGLEKNLSVVAAKIGHRYDATPLSTLITAPDSYFLLFSAVLITTLSLLKKSGILKFKSFVILLLISLSPVIFKMAWLDKNYKVAVNLKKIQILEGPSKIYNSMYELDEGQKIIVGKSLDEWLLIEWPVEYSGWVNRNELGLIK